ncbi:unnamed protein product [Miscanthus lutarioriparius]|uniref:HMA domain-containing protein n=1 Tax=Miscanthus lutarioriparius TaxID=422564 RepID=A0A811QH61_9POAL|nr:unnamed protein product [Miscanthus lutarioriparius]
MLVSGERTGWAWAHNGSTVDQLIGSLQGSTKIKAASPLSFFLQDMAPQKVVLKISAMSDEKVKQKAMETVADIYGINSIAADHKDQKMTVIGEMDTVLIAKKLKKFGKIDVVSVGPAKEEKKDEKKEGKK